MQVVTNKVRTRWPEFSYHSELELSPVDTTAWSFSWYKQAHSYLRKKMFASLSWPFCCSTYTPSPLEVFLRLYSMKYVASSLHVVRMFNPPKVTPQQFAPEVWLKKWRRTHGVSSTLCTMLFTFWVVWQLGPLCSAVVLVLGTESWTKFAKLCGYNQCFRWVPTVQMQVPQSTCKMLLQDTFVGSVM